MWKPPSATAGARTRGPNAVQVLRDPESEFDDTEMESEVEENVNMEVDAEPLTPPDTVQSAAAKTPVTTATAASSANPVPSTSGMNRPNTSVPSKSVSASRSINFFRCNQILKY